jgi:hypothetical protein
MLTMECTGVNATVTGGCPASAPQSASSTFWTLGLSPSGCSLERVWPLPSWATNFRKVPLAARGAAAFAA